MLTNFRSSFKTFASLSLKHFNPKGTRHDSVGVFAFFILAQSIFTVARRCSPLSGCSWNREGCDKPAPPIPHPESAAPLLHQLHPTTNIFMALVTEESSISKVLLKVPVSTIGAIILKCKEHFVKNWPQSFGQRSKKNYQKTCPRAKHHLWRAMERPGISRYDCFRENNKQPWPLCMPNTQDFIAGKTPKLKRVWSLQNILTSLWNTGRFLCMCGLFGWFLLISWENLMTIVSLRN